MPTSLHPPDIRIAIRTALVQDLSTGLSLFFNIFVGFYAGYSFLFFLAKPFSFCLPRKWLRRISENSDGKEEEGEKASIESPTEEKKADLQFSLFTDAFAFSRCSLPVPCSDQSSRS